MFDWDDLKVFIAVSRAGSLSGASQKLSIDAATVGRRLARLETALRSTLFARSPSGLQMTASGARLLEAALEAEAVMLKAENSGRDDTIVGSVRISAAEGFGTIILAPALPSLRAQRPGLRIELAAHAGFLSPSKREVDMAVTLSAPESARVVVEPLTYYQLTLYASHAYLSRAGVPEHVGEIIDHDLVGYVDDLIYAPELRYLDEIDGSLHPAIASSSIRAQREIIAAGGGLGVLPCFLAGDLVPVLSDTVLLTRRFWMSTQVEVAGTARLRSVRRWLFDLVANHHAALMPHRPVGISQARP